MSEKLTEEQIAAIQTKGKIIVSASAGSGKTFVMIQKLSDLIEAGGDLDEVLAVTFTKKAAAQMKEKLRSSLITRIATAEGAAKAHIKTQLNKIQSADISTIHSFCSHLVRTYFYALDIDSSFDIIADDDAVAMTYKYRALDSLFDRLYDENNASFNKLLSCLRRKRSDDSIKFLLLEAHKNARMIADYEGLLGSLSTLYTQEGFNKVCKEYKTFADEKCRAYLKSVQEYRGGFSISAGQEIYEKIFDEMEDAICGIIDGDDIFAPLPKLYTTTKPRAKEETKEASDDFTSFRDGLKKKLESLYADLGAREEEEQYFYKSGELALAFADVLLAFDREYTAVKMDEGKLDYNDLEHFTLKLLKNDEIKAQINAKYKYVFVDEYQDVNPVQEEILTSVSGGDSFTVGDVKQAIYGFRGSKSLFFAQKYHRMMGGEGVALKLSNNFRSSDGVINFVNTLFSRSMKAAVCGFDYKTDSIMLRGGGYPEGYGQATVHVFGEDEDTKEEASGIYSVKENLTARKGHTREGLAVLEIVKRELSSKRYDLKSKSYVDIQAGDICILTRKHSGKSVTGIVRALTDAGYSVSGAKQTNLCDRTEVKQIIDILSYIDNCQQDIPLASALVSPIGGFSEDELAQIKIAQTRAGEKLTFRECAINYATTKSDSLAHKLAAFFKRIYSYRRLSDILGAAGMIDKILTDSGLSAKYAAGGGEKLAGIRKLAEEAYTPSGELHINAFLNKLKAGGYRVNAPATSSNDSIKIMTMHASKGLEFPVVIIADACAAFGGRDISDMPFDDMYGFAPKYYDEENKLQYKTILARLCKMRTSREEIKNELNLYYVACTRAMCSLHIMCEKLEEFDEANILSAANYAELCDFSPFTPEFMEVEDFDGDKAAEQILIAKPDEEMLENLQNTFESKYAYVNSVNLPVKSSASELLKMGEEDNYYAENELFPAESGEFVEEGELLKEDKLLKENEVFKEGELLPAENALTKAYDGGNGESNGGEDTAVTNNSLNEIADEFTAATDKKPAQKAAERAYVRGNSTSAERGTAYHRFLELCDFNVKSRAGIAEELENFEKSGLMPKEQRELLNVDNLVDIMALTAFERLDGCTLYREQEFLCRLPANQFLQTEAEDGVLIQGAIDLLAVGGETTKIIDYKYSKKDDELLKKTYAAQLDLYKKAVACILKIDEKNIKTTIINIYRLSEINL